IDAPPDRRATRGAENGPQRLRIARREHVAERTARDAAHDQACRAVTAAAIIPVVRAAINPIAPTEPAFTVVPIIPPVVPRGVVVTLSRFRMVVVVAPPFTAMVSIVSIVIAIPSIALIFLTIAILRVLREDGDRRHRNDAGQQCTRDGGSNA